MAAVAARLPVREELVGGGDGERARAPAGRQAGKAGERAPEWSPPGAGAGASGGSARRPEKGAGPSLPAARRRPASRHAPFQLPRLPSSLLAAGRGTDSHTHARSGSPPAFRCLCLG